MTRLKRSKRSKRPSLSRLSNDYEHDIQLKLGYNFIDKSILLKVLQASGNGVSQVGNRRITDGNKRLAMVGDSVLQLVVLDDWFIREESRGQFLMMVNKQGCCSLQFWDD